VVLCWEDGKLSLVRKHTVVVRKSFEWRMANGKPIDTLFIGRNKSNENIVINCWRLSTSAVYFVKKTRTDRADMIMSWVRSALGSVERLSLNSLWMGSGTSSPSISGAIPWVQLGGLLATEIFAVATLRKRKREHCGIYPILDDRVS